jgi:hypothetical protein
MSIFNSSFQSVPCKSNNMCHARQCRCLNDNRNVEFVACQTVWKRIWRYDYKEQLYRNITEPVLQYDTDAHSSEDEDISAQSNGEIDNDTDDVSDTNFTQWTDNTNCQPTVPIVHKFTGGASEL